MTLGGVGSIDYYRFSRSSGTGPVEPVKPVGQIDPTESGTPVKIYRTADPGNKILPGIEMGPDILRFAADARIERLGEDDLNKLREGSKAKTAAEVMEESECKTCEERKYQDGSDDPGVSFKTPTNLSPEQAASAVRGHEMEHVVREQAAAQREGKEVVQQSVTIHTAICPECGRVYISGGTTRTSTQSKPEKEPMKFDTVA